ncbi:MAG: glycosyltransferase, partial [Pirellulales bacterium]|nr:glycosyltransferase [Pirellulales bacterium]
MQFQHIAEICLWSVIGLWAYTMLGYPLLMALLGRNHRAAPPAADEDLPPLTLIIPAHNEEAVIEEKLKNTQSIDYPPGKLEILVVSDGSSDQTVPLAKRYESDRLTVLDFSARRGKTSIVNDAVTKASGEVLCLCDT